MVGADWSPNCESGLGARSDPEPPPDNLVAKFSDLKGLAFAKLAGRSILVDPTMRIVIDVAAQ